MTNTSFTYSATVEVELTMEQLANIIVHLGSDQQAQLISLMAEVDFSIPTQLQYVTDDEALTDGGRRLMELIGAYARPLPAGGAPAMTTLNRAQRLLDEFHEGATKWDGGFSIRHGLAAVLLHIKATEQDAESFYAIPQDRLESLVDELTAPTLIEQAMLGDRDAARRFLHEAGFTDASGNWLPQYQPLEEADD